MRVSSDWFEFSGPLFNVTPKVDGIVINASDVTIRGLAIYGAARGIVVSGTSSVSGPVKIQGCIVGTTETNQLVVINFGPPLAFGLAQNSSHGIYLAPTAGIAFALPRVVIGTDGDGVNDANEGNLITNNAGDGVFIDNSDFSAVAGNFIGTTVRDLHLHLLQLILMV